MVTKTLVRISISATLMLTALSPTYAGFGKQRIYITNNPLAPAGGVLWSTAEYIDFGTTAASAGREWDLAETGEKKAFFQLSAPAGAGAQCYEISTSKGATATDVAETGNPDTKLVVYDPAPTIQWKLVSDDIDVAKQVYTSRVRVWANAPFNLKFYVAPYSLDNNKIDFYLIKKSLKITTAATCKGANMSFVNATTSPYGIIVF